MTETRYNLKKLWQVSSTLGPVGNQLSSFRYALQWPSLCYSTLWYCKHCCNSVIISSFFTLKKVLDKACRWWYDRHFKSCVRLVHYELFSEKANAISFYFICNRCYTVMIWKIVGYFWLCILSHPSKNARFLRYLLSNFTEEKCWPTNGQAVPPCYGLILFNLWKGH